MANNGSNCERKSQLSGILTEPLSTRARAVKVTKSYSRRLPALERFYRETKFSLFKSTH